MPATKVKDKLPLGFSIVLCTYNGQKLLRPTLEHLAVLQIPAGCGVELILVNNASADNTSAFVQDTWVELDVPFPLHILDENRSGKGYAVETGYDAAEYSYILTVDDDNWLSSDYLVMAVNLFKQHPDVGVLQGRNEAVYETELPAWATELQSFFVIGGPRQETGYFPKNFFSVWGAGMIIFNSDWKYLRKNGFAFLTSKNPGKAAGEDHETAIALLLLGRKIYYSEKLTYKHYMPADRISWESLKKGFRVWSYLHYYYYLYALVIDAHEKKYPITNTQIKKKLTRHTKYFISNYTWKQHLAYWIRPRQEFYQLGIYREFSFYNWFYKLSSSALHDISFLQSWMLPLLDQKPGIFRMPAYL